MNGREKTIDDGIKDMLERESRETRCKWCHPNEEGRYFAARFLSPDNKSSITVFFAQANMTVQVEHEGETAGMKMETFFCPICGRKVREGYRAI